MLSADELLVALLRVARAIGDLVGHAVLLLIAYAIGCLGA